MKTPFGSRNLELQLLRKSFDSEHRSCSKKLVSHCIFHVAARKSVFIFSTCMCYEISIYHDQPPCM